MEIQRFNASTHHFEYRELNFVWRYWNVEYVDIRMITFVFTNMCNEAWQALGYITQTPPNIITRNYQTIAHATFLDDRNVTSKILTFADVCMTSFCYLTFAMLPVSSFAQTYNFYILFQCRYILMAQTNSLVPVNILRKLRHHSIIIYC